MSLFRGRIKNFGGGWFGWPQGTYPDPERIPRNSELATTSSAMLVNEQSSLALSAVSACVSLIADSIASLPLDAYRKRGGARQEVTPIPPLVADTFGDGNPQDGFFQALYSLLMRGNWYSFKIRDSRIASDSGNIVGLSPPIHPNIVKPEIKDGELVYKIGNQEHEARDVFHLRGFTIPGVILGLGPLDYARETLGLGLAQQEFGARFFAQDATPPFTITTPVEMSADAIEDMIKVWKKHHQGIRNSFEPGVLTGGADLKQLSVTPENAQFLESRKFQVAEVARLFRVPPHMIGDVERSTSWGTGIEVQGIGYTTYTLGPWTTRIERAISSLLPRPQYAKFNVAALLRADTLTRYEAYERARNAGWLNPDEIRELEDRAPIPDGKGQDYLQPLNYAPAGSPAAVGTGKEKP